MKILAGRFGGRKIKTSKNLSYRPTKSLVRKSLFDSLAPFPHESVLDLFAGSGVLGFEAASRGAGSIVFVDNDKRTINYLKENSSMLAGPQYDFYESDAFQFLKNEKSFDLIFADPPYLKYDMSLLIESVLGHLNKKGKFILECDRKQEPILQASHKDYGQTRILFWENT